MILRRYSFLEKNNEKQLNLEFKVAFVNYFLIQNGRNLGQ